MMADGASLITFYEYESCSDCFSRTGKHTPAVFYCPDCNKYNCRRCYVCDHDVLGRRNVDRWGQPSKRAQFDPCPKHRGNMLQLYCRKHDVVCCPVCSQSEHKSCGDSVYIPLVAYSKDSTADLQKVKKGLGELHLKADKTSKDRTTKLTCLDQTEQGLLAGVMGVRASAEVLLNNMETKSLDDIARFKALWKDRYKSELDMCDNIKTEVNDLEKKIESASADKSLLFSRIKQGTEQVRDKSGLLTDITRSSSSYKAEFKPYTEIETLLKSRQGLGKFLSDMPYRTVFKTNFYVNSFSIQGMCMMPSGDLILAGWNNTSLMKLSSQYEVTASCCLTAPPYDVCHTEAGKVAVALGDQTVQLWKVSGSMSRTSSIFANHDCNSLAYSNKCLYITSYRGTAVYVYNLAGTQLRVITQDQHGNQLFSSTRRITTSRGLERLHITGRKYLVTIDTRGKLISRFTSGELTGGPNCVCADGEGNVFVGGLNSNNVLQVGGEADKKLAELLSHVNGIKVHRLCFDGPRSRLLVASDRSDTVHVLHLLK